jgi:hypothetical protein
MAKGKKTPRKKAPGKRKTPQSRKPKAVVIIDDSSLDENPFEEAEREWLRRHKKK